MGDRSAPDLFTALSLEPPRATPPIGRDARSRTREPEPDPHLDPLPGAPDEIEEMPTSPTGLPASGSPAIEPPTKMVEPAALHVERVVAAQTAASSGIPPSPFGGSLPIGTPMPPPPPRPVTEAAPTTPRSRAPQRTEVVPALPPRPTPKRRRLPAPAAPARAAAPAPSERGGLADLLEPSDGRAVEGLDDLVAEMSLDLSTSTASSPLVALDDPKSYPAPGMSGIRRAVVPSIPPSPDWDEPVRRGRGVAWIFVPVSLVLAGTLGWVLYTQTDLFAGDIVARRDAEVEAEVAQEQEAAHEAAEAAKKERGTLTLSSEPAKARVWMVRRAPEATFSNLPIDGEYMVAVTAEGHQPRVRVVKGSELVAPVVVDLDPLPEEAKTGPTPEIPPAPVPKVGRDAKRTTDLVLRSNTPGAALMLMVGYTPGATIVDLDVGETHELLVTLEGHESHAIELKGRHWEETEGGGLVYDETVALTPRAAAPAGSPAGSAPSGADAQGDAKAQK